MKRSLIVLSFATIITSGVAGAQPFSTEERWLDRTLPTYPELGLDVARGQLQVADGYRFNAGESSHDMVVQDVG